MIENYTLFSFNEIITINNEYKKKILSIFEKHDNEKKINFNKKVKQNIYKEEKFDIHLRHKTMIEEFIYSNENVDFSLILN